MHVELWGGDLCLSMLILGCKCSVVECWFVVNVDLVMLSCGWSTCWLTLFELIFNVERIDLLVC